MRAKGAHRFAGHRRGEVVIQHRRRAHRIDAGLGAGRMAHVGAIAGGKERVVALHAQIRPHPHEAVIGERQGRAGEPVMRTRAGCAHGEAAGDLPPVRERHRARLDPHRARAGHRLDPEPAHGAEERRAGAGIGGGDLAPRLDQADLWLHAPRVQGMGHGQRQLGPGNAAADHRHLRRHLARQRPGAKILPARGIEIERLGAGGVGGKALDLGHLGMDAHVDRGHVPADLAPVGEPHQPGRRVDRLGMSQHEAGTREARELHQIDLQRRAWVMPGNIARQHPRIGRGRVRVDQREAHTLDGLHPPHPRHQRVGMASADQHQVAYENKALPHDVIPPVTLPL